MGVFDDKAIVSRFPAKAREKIVGMTMHRVTLRAACVYCDSETRAALADLQQAVSIQRQYGDEPGTSSKQKQELAAKIQECQSVVDDCNATAREARRLQDEGTAALQHLEARVAFWLRNGINEFPQFDGPAPKPLKGKGNPIAAARDRMIGLHEEIEKLRNAPYPAAECKIKARAALEAPFEAGRPDVANLIEGFFPICWPMQPVPGPMPVTGGGMAMPVSADPRPDWGSLALWALKDQILAAVDAEIDLRGDDEHALGSEERAEREQVLLAELLALERAEEAAIEAAEAEGLAIARRPDSDPRAVFGLADALPYQPEI